MAYILLLGDIDLSVGANVCLSGTIMGIVFNATNNIWLAILACLATGTLCGAINGLMQIVEDAGATLVGAGVCIEKGWQPGGDHLRGKGIKLVSLAICDRIENGKVICRD